MLGAKYIEEKKVQEFRQSGRKGTGKKGTINKRSQSWVYARSKIH